MPSPTRILVAFCTLSLFRLTSSSMHQHNTSEPSSPHALIFTPSSIISSTISPSGHLSTTIFPASLQYQSWFSTRVNTAQNDRRIPWNQTEINETASILKHDLWTIMQDLDHSSSITAIILPTFLSKSVGIHWVLANLLWDGEPLSQGGEGARRTRQYAHAAGLAYELEQCGTWSHTDVRCNDDGVLDDLFMVLEYEKEYLQVSLLSPDVEYGVFPSVWEEASGEFGEGKRGLARGLKKEEEEDVEGGVREYIDGVVERLTAQQYHGSARNDIRKIVVMGGAPEAAIQRLGKIAVEAVNNTVAQLLEEIDGGVVAVYGAALFARRIAMAPEPEEYSDRPLGWSPDEQKKLMETLPRLRLMGVEKIPLGLESGLGNA